MSAQARPADVAAASLRPMRVDDLESVLDIELRAYPFPWTRGIFHDCLRAGYPAWVLEQGHVVIGYGMLNIGADEAHVAGDARREHRRTPQRQPDAPPP